MEIRQINSTLTRKQSYSIIDSSLVTPGERINGSLIVETWYGGVSTSNGTILKDSNPLPQLSSPTSSVGISLSISFEDECLTSQSGHLTLTWTWALLQYTENNGIRKTME